MQQFLRQGIEQVSLAYLPCISPLFIAVLTQGNYLRSELGRRPDLFRFPVVTDLGLVCFQLLDRNGNPDNAKTKGVADHLRTKNFFLFPSMLNGESILRLAGGGVLTDKKHIQELIREVVAYSTR